MVAALRKLGYRGHFEGAKWGNAGWFWKKSLRDADAFIAERRLQESLRFDEEGLIVRR